MRYPKIKIDGEPIKVNKRVFDWLHSQIRSSIELDNKENELGLSSKDIRLISWNASVMAYHRDLEFKTEK